MANSYDMKRRISAPVTVSLTVAFIAVSGPCAAQVTNKPVLTFDGKKQIIAAAQATPGLNPSLSMSSEDLQLLLLEETLLDGKTIGSNEISGMQLNGLKSPLT
jgi:hypothetical protein